MKHFALIVAAFSVFAGCTVAPSLPEGETVSISKMLTDTRGRPYECFNYDAATDSCEGIAKRRVTGDRIHFDVSMLVPGPKFDMIKISISASFKIEGARYCGNMRNAEITAKGDLNPAEKSVLEEVILAQMISLGDLCGAYVRGPSGAYTSVTTDREGRILPDGMDRVWFFDQPRKLRLAV